MHAKPRKLKSEEVSVTIRELRQRLNEIAWLEQVEDELDERPGLGSSPALESIDVKLRSLASSIDSTLLDALEKEEGYLIWVLRLASFVEPEHARQRAHPYVHSANWRVQYWARKIAR